MKNDEFLKLLDEIVPNPKCTLEYTYDYELLIATVLSAQCTDERVNKVTKILFSKYNIYDLASLQAQDIIDIIRPCGNMNKKSEYIIKISQSLVDNYQGHVPNNREYLENLPGVGRKTANVVLGNIYNVPTFAVDTHIERVSKRLGFASPNDDVLTIEKKLMNLFPADKWVRLHHQLLLFGRYTCKSRHPLCESCKLKKYCQKIDNPHLK